MFCTKEEMSAMLTGAMEGGSNNWYTITNRKAPKKWSYMSWGNKTLDPPMTTEEIMNSPLKKDIFFQYDYPLNLGGSITVANRENMEDRIKVDLKRLRKGCALMRTNYPRIYEKMKNDLGDCDGDCADLFFQLAVWEEIVFG